MKKLSVYILCGIVLAMLLMPIDVAYATELVWVPINPSFGGSPLNASWLLSSAQAQNRHVDNSSSYSSSSTDLLGDFESRLNSQILYRLSSKIVEEAFGEDSLIPEGQTEAQYVIGDYSVTVSTDLSKVTVTLTDPANGGTTTLEVPYF